MNSLLIKIKILIFFIPLLFSIPQQIFAERLLFYLGNAIDEGPKDVIFDPETTYIPSKIYVFAYQNNFKEMLPNWLEYEIQLGKHEGLQNHFETNIALNFRSVWEFHSLEASAAIGEGFSYAWEHPKYEESLNRSSRFLNYLMLELTMGSINWPGKPRFFVRLHHRSGVFGTFCEDLCGSDFITYGSSVKF